MDKKKLAAEQEVETPEDGDDVEDAESPSEVGDGEDSEGQR